MAKKIRNRKNNLTFIVPDSEWESYIKSGLAEKYVIDEEIPETMAVRTNVIVPKEVLEHQIKKQSILAQAKREANDNQTTNQQ